MNSKYNIGDVVEWFNYASEQMAYGRISAIDKVSPCAYEYEIENDQLSIWIKEYRIKAKYIKQDVSK